MIERCHAVLPWFSLGQIVNVGSGFVIKDLMVRWNERTEIREEPEGSIEYVYDMYRFDLELPPEIEPGREAVEYYLEHAKMRSSRMLNPCPPSRRDSMLSEEKKKEISDIAKGQSINSAMSIEAQIAAIRKQIDVILADNPKTPIDPDYKKLSEIVGKSEKPKNPGRGDQKA